MFKKIPSYKGPIEEYKMVKSPPKPNVAHQVLQKINKKGGLL